MEPTAYSVRYAPASGSGSCPAFGYSGSAKMKDPLPHKIYRT
jgi:hypothetical protein